MNSLKKRVFKPDWLKRRLGDIRVIILDDDENFFKSMKDELDLFTIPSFHAQDENQVLELIKKYSGSDFVNRLNLLILVDLQLEEGQNPNRWRELGGYLFIKNHQDLLVDHPVMIVSAFLLRHIPSEAIEEFARLGVVQSLNKTDPPGYLLDVVLASYLVYHQERLLKFWEVEREKATIRGNAVRGIFHALIPQLNALSFLADEISEKCPDIREDLEETKRRINRVKGLRQIDSRLINIVEELGKPLGRLDIAAWLREYLGNVPEYLDLKGLELRASFPSQPIFVQASAEVLDLVLENLLSNASLALKRTGRKELHVSLKEEKGHAIVTVEDEGGGFPEEILPVLLRQPVSTWDFDDKDEHGFGLVISEKLIKTLLKGFLIPENRSVDGQTRGARVAIKLPLRNAPQGGSHV